MPLFERSKGKFHYEIHQYEHALSVREWMGSDQRLAGYCMYSDAVVALGELGRLLRAKSAEGFVPADDDAKALAASLKLKGPAPKKAPELPLRRDIHVYNEATGFAIASLKLAGKGMEDGDRKWNKALNDGLLMPVSLYQDDSFCIRVVAGDSLTAQEKEEWVGRLERRLNLADGKLCVSGGSEWLYPGYDPAGVVDDNFVRIVELPKGYYRATLYSYLAGVNGDACLDHLACGHDQAEPIGQWFRRTRPGEPFPAWLVYRCVAYPDTDPGHEEEWRKTPLPEGESMPEFAGFLLHLEPIEPPSEGSKKVKLEITGGWFDFTEGARKPDRCPLGLVAKDVTGHEKRAEGAWIYPREIFPLVTAYNSVPLDGGPVDLPIERVADVFRLARFCHRNLAPELHATLPPGADFPLDGKWPDNFVAIRVDGTLRFLITPTLECLVILHRAAGRLKGLPDSTVLELVTSQLRQGPPTGDRPVATHRYRGTVAGGVWHISATFPAANAEALRGALALSEESRQHAGFKLWSQDEAEKIQTWSKKNLGMMISDNPPLHDGDFIRLKEPVPGDYQLVGSAVFAVRFGHIWPVFEFSD